MSAIACAIAFTLIGYAIRVVLGPYRLPPTEIKNLIIKCDVCGGTAEPIYAQGLTTGGTLTVAYKLDVPVCTCREW